MTQRDSDSDSSSDDDISRFAGVAVSAAQLEEQAEQSKQIAQQRQARARQRRAGGGGVLGAVPGDSSGDEGVEGGSAFLDAAQLKVAEALQRRLEAELDEAEVETLPPATQQGAPPPQATQQADQGMSGDEDTAGVRLFRRVKPGMPVVDPQQQQQAQQQAGEGGSSRRPHVRELRHLESPSKARCKAAAVEAADILAAAQAAAQQALSNMAAPPNWLPADDEPSRWSHRRKRRAAKLAAEAEAWQRQRAVQT